MEQLLSGGKMPTPTKKGSTTWSPFPETTKYFEPSTKDFMINYRVENLEALVEELKKEGVTIVDTIEAMITVNLFTLLTWKVTKLNCGNPLIEHDKKLEDEQNEIDTTRDNKLLMSLPALASALACK